MTYYVYENWTHKRARVHRGDCSYCNQGRGTQPADSGKNGQWHGAFATFDVAQAVAASLKRDDTASCQSCCP